MGIVEDYKKMKFTFARRENWWEDEKEVIHEAVYRDEVKKGRDFCNRMAKLFWERFEADMKALEEMAVVEVLKNAKVIEDKEKRTQ